MAVCCSQGQNYWLSFLYLQTKYVSEFNEVLITPDEKTTEKVKIGIIYLLPKREAAAID